MQQRLSPSLSRRLCLGVAASAVVAPALWAQTFGAKPIRWVVVAPAGSSLDVIARAMQDKLRDQLGTPIVIENKPQVGGTAGTARGNQKVTCITVFNFNDFTQITQVDDLVEQNNLHGRAP